MKFRRLASALFIVIFFACNVGRSEVPPSVEKQISEMNVQELEERLELLKQQEHYLAQYGMGPNGNNIEQLKQMTVQYRSVLMDTERELRKKRAAEIKEPIAKTPLEEELDLRRKVTDIDSMLVDCKYVSTAFEASLSGKLDKKFPLLEAVINYFTLQGKMKNLQQMRMAAKSQLEMVSDLFPTEGSLSGCPDVLTAVRKRLTKKVETLGAAAKETQAACNAASTFLKENSRGGGVPRSKAGPSKLNSVQPKINHLIDPK